MAPADVIYFFVTNPSAAMNARVKYMKKKRKTRKKTLVFIRQTALPLLLSSVRLWLYETIHQSFFVILLEVVFVQREANCDSTFVSIAEMKSSYCAEQIDKYF